MPFHPIATCTTPCSARNDVDSATSTRRQTIGLTPRSRTLSCRTDSGDAADFTDSMTENYVLPRDSIKVDPMDFCTSPPGASSLRAYGPHRDRGGAPVREAWHSKAWRTERMT